MVGFNESKISNEDNTNCQKKTFKKGIIYLSTIPPYMNVTRIREYFSEFGTVGRVFLQLQIQGDKNSVKKSKRKIAKKFTEGWVEFEKKTIAKKVAQFLNNKQVSTRKKSKHFDCIWNIKYLSGFKWVHLHERLAYEKAARKQKLRAEIQLAKKKANYFNSNLTKKKLGNVRNREYENIDQKLKEKDSTDHIAEERNDFLTSLFS